MSRRPHTSPMPEVPPHLKPFVVEQRYDLYTAIDHAVWRYVIRQNSRALKGRAHEAYLSHFTETGMTVESIPNIERMNRFLTTRGWRAVAVDGFIPPGVFMDFQAHGFLPIAQDIRTLEHIAYTPAPDIIHEAAGHAPLILDPYFGEFLRFIGELGAKAIATREDHEVYESIRNISIQKENPHATPEQIRAAELRLEAAIEANHEVSEAAELSRLYWWTVEYGLVGSLDTPRIYGAGLCSSMSEGGDCLKESVQKVPFDLSCIHVSYDITRPQPQLFVARNFEQLVSVTREFAQRMAVYQGGTVSLLKALHSGKVATAVYKSGLQVSGVISELLYDAGGEAVLFHLDGPAALAEGDVELDGFGCKRFPDGLWAPVGAPLGFSEGLSGLSDEELGAQGVRLGEPLSLRYACGVEVTGTVYSLVRRQGKLLVMELSNAVLSHDARPLVQSALLALPLEGQIVSVFSGTADKVHFVVERHPSPVVNLRAPQNALEQELEQLYTRVRQMRVELFGDTDAQQPGESAQARQRREAARSVEAVEAKFSVAQREAFMGVLRSVMTALDARHPQDWLLRVEVLEVLAGLGWLPELQSALVSRLNSLKDETPGHAQLIHNGMTLALSEAAVVA